MNKQKKIAEWKELPGYEEALHDVETALRDLVVDGVWGGDPQYNVKSAWPVGVLTVKIGNIGSAYYQLRQTEDGQKRVRIQVIYGTYNSVEYYFETSVELAVIEQGDGWAVSEHVKKYIVHGIDRLLSRHFEKQVFHKEFEKTKKKLDKYSPAVPTPVPVETRPDTVMDFS